MSLAALQTAAGRRALAAAQAVAGGDPAVAAVTLRAQGHDPDLAAAALTQARLRHRARAKFGIDAATMYFTGAGLEQATRPTVAARRAQRLRDAGVRTVADLGCGIGADTIAFARAGLRVRAVEADPETAAVAAANLDALGLAQQVEVVTGDATRTDLAGVDAVFCDPSRRSPTGRRVFDPRACAPPWDFVLALPERVGRTVVKLAPGIDHALLPAGTEAEWVSVDGEVVEAALWCGPLATVPRRASVLRGGDESGLSGSGTRQAPVTGLRRFLYDPDGAVVRAHLVAEFASTVDGGLADPEIAYVYADRALPTPYARGFEVVEALPFSLKRLRAAVRARDVGIVEIRKRGSALVPEELRGRLRLTGSRSITVVLTRVASAPYALLCQPLSGPTPPSYPVRDGRRDARVG